MQTRAYANAAPLLTDDRLAQIEERVRHAYPTLPDESIFVSAVVENPLGALEGHFLMFAPDPSDYRHENVRTQATLSVKGTVKMRDWEASEAERKRFVGKPDPAYGFYAVMARDMVEKIDNLKAIID